MREIIHKLFFILPKGDPIKVFMLFGLMLIAAALEVIGIGMIPAFVSIVASPERVLELEIIQPLLNSLEIESSRDLLLWGSGVLVGVFVLKSAYILLFNYIQARFIYNRRYTISHRMMSNYMKAPYTFHLQRNTAELLRNITQEVTILINDVLRKILSISKEGVMALSILLLLFVAEPLITLMVIFFAGFGAGTFLYFTRKKVKEYGEQEQVHRREMIKAVNQGLGGLKDARVLNREAEFIEKFSTEARRSTRLLTYISYIKKVPQPLIETIAVMGMMLIASILVWQGRPMSTIIPILTLFGMAIVRLMPAVRTITSDYTYLMYNLVSINPIYNDLRELDDNSKKFIEDRKKTTPLIFKGVIDINNISFTYPNSNEITLKNISLQISRGSAIGLIGESGAGKSTIVDLILGLMEPSSGEIMVDGINIHKNLSAWQQKIGYIPQSIYLADETLKSNVAFGLPEEEIDEDKVIKALKMAQLESLVDQLPDGLNTLLGEHGTRLSGGQRQRVGIARALYHDPDVLVMDEATSALDNLTEKEISKSIDSLKGDRTIIMIAHRLSTVKNCDILYLMKEGVIFESGTYDELVKNNQEFKKMALIS